MPQAKSKEGISKRAAAVKAQKLVKSIAKKERVPTEDKSVSVQKAETKLPPKVETKAAVAAPLPAAIVDPPAPKPALPAAPTGSYSMNEAGRVKIQSDDGEDGYAFLANVKAAEPVKTESPKAGKKAKATAASKKKAAAAAAVAAAATPVVTTASGPEKKQVDPATASLPVTSATNPVGLPDKYTKGMKFTDEHTTEWSIIIPGMPVQGPPYEKADDWKVMEQKHLVQGKRKKQNGVFEFGFFVIFDHAGEEKVCKLNARQFKYIFPRYYSDSTSTTRMSWKKIQEANNWQMLDGEKVPIVDGKFYEKHRASATLPAVKPPKKPKDKSEVKAKGKGKGKAAAAAAAVTTPPIPAAVTAPAIPPVAAPEAKPKKSKKAAATPDGTDAKAVNGRAAKPKAKGKGKGKGKGEAELDSEIGDAKMAEEPKALVPGAAAFAQPDPAVGSKRKSPTPTAATNGVDHSPAAKKARVEVKFTAEEKKWALKVVTEAVIKKNEKMIAKFTAEPDPAFGTGLPELFWVNMIKTNTAALNTVPLNESFNLVGGQSVYVHLIRTIHKCEPLYTPPKPAPKAELLDAFDDD